MPVSPGPSVRVDESNGIYQVSSTPYPIHRASVERGALNRWSVTVHTASVRKTWHGSLREALHTAGSHIATLYRVDMGRRFTGPQRHAMALGNCPAHIPCRDAGGCQISTGHVHLCRAAPWFASVWCERHQAVGERNWRT